MELYKMFKTTKLLSIFMVLSFIYSCEKEDKPGFLTINAAFESQSVEIFKINDNDDTFSLTGEVVVAPNTKMELDPGTYLVMADCSHELIILRPYDHIKLNLTRLKLLPPEVNFDPSDFSIQCDRFKASIFRQQLTGNFELNILEGERNMLVNMAPLRVIQKPKHIQTPNLIHLSALRVGQEESEKALKQKYFISLLDETISITKPMQLGRWFLGLEGNYEISINGTKKNIKLQEKSIEKVNLGGLLVSPPKNVDLTVVSKVRGYPYTIKIDGKHELLPNSIYSLLPGVLEVTLDQSKQKTKVEIYESELTKIPLKSVQVALDCAPWEWECLGRREVMLYQNQENYPFLESITDIPILFIGSDIKLGIAESRGIKVDIPNNKFEHKFSTGTLILKPEILSSKNYITDLVRLASGSKNIKGKSLDIPKLRLSKMRLIAGKYKLEYFQTSLGDDGERWSTNKSFHISANKITRINVPFYVNEKNIRNCRQN